nr:RNA methyltransferase [uncultured Halomonas sp.]
MLSNIRIVLVQTFHPGNIGASARAMKTMGLSHLTLVNPRCFPDDEATQLAAGAEDIITNTAVTNTLAEAVAACVQVIGASARLRNLPLPHFDEPDIMALNALACARQGPVALVFGRERFGLTNDEIRHCTHQVSIPANPDYGILNIAQAVQVLCYELFRALQRSQSNMQRTVHQQTLLPSQQQLSHFHEHLQQVMTKVGFLTQPHARTEEHLHALFARAQLSRKELSILRGLLSAIEKRIE